MRVTFLDFIVVLGVLGIALTFALGLKARRHGNDHAIVYGPMGALAVYLFGWSLIRHVRWLVIIGLVLLAGAYAYQFLYVWWARRERNRARPGQGTSGDHQGSSVGR